MTTLLPKEPVVEALAAEFAHLDDLLGGLTDHDWARPTALPGWDVKDNVAHVIGTESMLAGIAAPESDVDLSALPHVRNDIGVFNEAWIQALRPVPPAEVLARYRELTAERIDALRAMDQEAWDAEGFTPAGADTHGRFMRIRVFDTWMHEQDIRDAVGRPGHHEGPVVELVLDEMSASLGYVVGKRAGAPTSSSVTFDLTGPSSRRIHVEVGDRAAVVDELPGPATATLTMPVHTFSRVAGGRIDATQAVGDVGLSGDRDLARQVLDHLAYTI